MIAQFIEFEGDTIGLCLVRQNLTEDPEISLEFPTAVTRHPRSKKESRRTFARSARYQFSYLATLRTAAEVTEMQKFLDALKDQAVAVPLWNDVCRLTAAKNIGQTSLPIDNHPVRSGDKWIVISDDNSTYEIVTATAVTATTLTLAAPGLTLNWPSRATFYPLLIGYIPPEDRPVLAAITPSRSSFNLKFKENSPFARRLKQYDGATIREVGTTVPDQATLPLWDIMPVYERPLHRSDIDTTYSREGPGRIDLATAYDQFPAHGIHARFHCRNRAAIAKIEKFFADRRGAVSIFMLPTFRNDLVLAQDLPIAGSPNLIRVETSQYTAAGRPLHPNDAYLALWDRGSDLWSTTVPIEPQKVEDVDANELTTTIAIAGTHLKSNTIISQLLLVRLVESQMTWKYLNGATFATCEQNFLELPNEYTAPSDVLPEDAFIAIVTEDYPGATVQRITNYEDELVLPVGQGEWAGTYTPVNASFGSIRRSIDPAANKILNKFGGDFTGNPLKKFFPFALEGRIRIKVGVVDVVDLTHPVRYRQSGEITEPSPSLMEAEAVAFGRLWDSKNMVPRFILSVVDNFQLGDELLAVDQAALRFGATILAVDGTTLVCGPLAGSPDPTGRPDDYFANGRMNIGAGANYQRRSVRSSTMTGMVVGTFEIVIDHPLRVYGVGDTFNLWPGYDGTIDQLEDKFSEFTAAVRGNHGGHPYVPDVPPNVRAVEAETSSGAKK